MPKKYEKVVHPKIYKKEGDVNFLGKHPVARIIFEGIFWGKSFTKSSSISNHINPIDIIAVKPNEINRVRNGKFNVWLIKFSFRCLLNINN